MTGRYNGLLIERLEGKDTANLSFGLRGGEGKDTVNLSFGLRGGEGKDTVNLSYLSFGFV